ncbi:DUF1403 family protein [Marivita sp. S0852]|uniref:DUF1403 family protein n=1 Tax=Marivita sp. S0852 TaxID=3373893 RepID=UPI003982BB62
MPNTHTPPVVADDMIPRIPAWITSRGVEDIENVSFLSGAALAHLHGVLARKELPASLLRDRLALGAAESCVALSGRPERAADLRDALHLMRPDDLPGPAGATYLSWHRAVARPVSVEALQRALPDREAEAILGGLDRSRQDTPVSQAAQVLEAVVTDDPRAQAPALIFADAVLAQALGWDHLVPLLATGLKRGDLRQRGAALGMACHRAIVAAVIRVVRLAGDLTRRAMRLHAVAPKLRAKAAPDAVAMFLSRDAVTPSALPLPDRSARRLCDRLVSLGAIRELTGRDTFRIYGL